MPAILVFLDSNAFMPHWHFTGEKWQPLRRILHEGNGRAATSRVVIQEIDKHHDLAVAAARRDTRKLLGRVPAELESLALPSQSDMFQPPGIEIADTPSDLSYEEISLRATHGRRPFTKDSAKGLRDTLIWHTLLAWAGRQRCSEVGEVTVLFVSNDKSAFGEGALAKSLQDEIPVGVVIQLVADLDQLNKQIAELARAAKIPERAHEWGMVHFNEEFERRAELALEDNDMLNAVEEGGAGATDGPTEEAPSHGVRSFLVPAEQQRSYVDSWPTAVAPPSMQSPWSDRYKVVQGRLNLTASAQVRVLLDEDGDLIATETVVFDFKTNLEIEPH